MSLNEALILSVKAPGAFDLLIATGTNRKRWYLVMEYWRTGRVVYGWCWDGRCLWIEETRRASSGVDWAPGFPRPRGS